MNARSGLLATASLLVGLASSAAAQQPATDTALRIPAVGDMAPDFTLRGITRYGTLRDATRLSDLRNQTVVLWFFVKARTRG